MAMQTVTLKVPTGDVDVWGKPEYEKVIIQNCVVQPQTIYSGTNNDRQIVANAIVFFYSGITTPLPVLKHD
ncbi:capsid protein, partial [Pediococcus acidilactici]|nr:capsid protein [Pediococcus acidilactici]